jgi:hypothetical protein
VKDLNVSEVPGFFEYDLRLDMDELPGLDIELVQEIAKVYKKKSVTAFFKWLSQDR